jgi:hypothetical protein
VIGLDVYNTVSPTRNLWVRKAGPGMAIAFAGDTIAAGTVARVAAGIVGISVAIGGWTGFADETLFAASDLPEIRRVAALRTTWFRPAFAGRFWTERLFIAKTLYSPIRYGAKNIVSQSTIRDSRTAACDKK